MATDPNARLRITADDDTKGAWAAATRTAKAGAGKIGNEIKGIFSGFAAGISINGLQKLVTDALEYGDAIGKAATKSGLGTNAISELAFAAKGADIELEDLSRALSKLQVSVSKAADGNKGLRDSFAELGAGSERFRRAAADKQFEALADAISRVPDEADKLRLAVEVLGPSGAKLLPLFSDGAEGIRKLREEFVRLGLSLDEDDQQKLEAAGDALEEMKGAAAGLGRVLGITLAPAIKGAADDLKNLIGVTKEATGEIGRLYEKIQKNEKAKGAFEFLKIVLNPFGTIRSLGLKAAADALSKDEPRPPFLYLPPVKDALLDAPRPARKDGDPEFTDAELAEFLGTGGSAARRRTRGDTETARTRSQDSVFAANLDRYENERAVLEELDRSIAESSAAIFEENQEAIAGYLDSIELDTFEVTEDLADSFKELGSTIEGTLADAFYNSGDSARDFADTVLDNFKRILADSAAKQLTGLIGSLFSPKKDPGVSDGGAAGGFSSLISGALLGGFGGPKAEGGPLDQGKWYVAGEKGPEPIWGGGSGAFAVGYGQQMAMSRQSAGVSINMPVSIDARGSTPDAVRMLEARLPGLLKKTSDDAVSRVKDEMRRGSLKRR